MLKRLYLLSNPWHEILLTTILIKTHYDMNNLLYAIAVILLIGWALGFFVYSAGSIIHLLLVIAVIAIIFRLIRGERI